MFARSTFVVACALLVIGVPLVQAKDEVPFKGSAVTKFVSEDLDTLTALYDIVEGNASHLGKLDGSAVVSYVQVSEDPPIYVPAGAEITFEAANGDELYMQTGAFGYVITGGTGRFDGATGSGDFATEVVDYVEGIVAITWEGDIDYKLK